MNHLSAMAQLLSSVYYHEATQPLINELQQQDLQSWPEIGTLELRQLGLSQLQLGLKQNPDLQRLAVDFVQLFIGCGQVQAPPWGSVYLDKDKLLNGDSTMALRRFLEQQKIQFQLTENQPVDHIGLIFAAMASLLEQQKLAAVEQLLTEHLLPWYPMFSQKLKDNAKTDYYRGWALLTDAFVEHLASIKH